MFKSSEAIYWIIFVLISALFCKQIMPTLALFVNQFLEGDSIAQMECLVGSLDFNSILHLWDSLGRPVADNQPPARIQHELRTSLRDQRPFFPCNSLTIP
ncbi:hypothetical protein NPIL_476131 [Nephila pilipes]|uniref:Uncharacterized protein n=1 Tax=Nephila pilipes TaxID=299642 RepID=A0A8X6TD82_NEPPI|nr:hypothetical protein NPIL_476131 [Nephila pilipes]